MIDARAVIDPKAELAANVEVGPYSVIGADVHIGEGTWIGPHVVIQGPTKIGRDNKIYQFSSIGEAPQDKKYAGEKTWLEIGDRNLIREYCTFNRGTVQGGGVTRLGNDNWIMAYVHLAHDCIVGNNTIFANNASLAGHVEVDDWVILGGYTLVHQFCRLGQHCFTAYASGISKDIPPYVTVSGTPASPHGLNTEGLRRRQFSPEAIADLKRAYKILYRSKLQFKEAIAQLHEAFPDSEHVLPLIEFLENTERGIVR